MAVLLLLGSISFQSQYCISLWLVHPKVVEAQKVRRQSQFTVQGKHLCGDAFISRMLKQLHQQLVEL